MRQGIYGGAFDPPHRGHLAAALASHAHLNLDSVLWIPCGIPALKHTASAGAADRLAMVNLVIAPYPQFSASSIELDRPGVSYMWQTLEMLATADGAAPVERWLIMGVDALGNFSRWRQPRRILDFVRLAVVDRPGEESRRIRAQQPDWVNEAIDWVQLDPVEAASRDIRAALAAGVTTGESPTADEITPEVADYIEKHRLYRVD